MRAGLTKSGLMLRMLSGLQSPQNAPMLENTSMIRPEYSNPISKFEYKNPEITGFSQ